MKTVDKALHLLDQFSVEHKEIGLSALARMAGLDKAATRRLLVALAKHGFIEQSAETKKYRLGHGFLRLARVREATVPVTQAAQQAADWLAAQTNETVHLSLPVAGGMTTIAHCLPNRARVINIIPSELLPYHATASGLAYLAFCDPATRNSLLSGPLRAYTEKTLTDRQAVLGDLDRFRAQGYTVTRNTFEDDVSSIGMPFFQRPGRPTGAAAIAVPAAELTQARQDALLPQLQQAVAELEQRIAG